ncbi:MAG: SLC13 family permease [Coriobacteriales bacterium]|jgi:anion transporter|nr:SLC13 family permease [Coriobacteriales bacterium]
MAPELIATAILIVVIVLFVTEAIPLPLTAVLGALAMAVFGIISFPEAFAGFSNDILMMVVGMLIIGRAVYESGLVDRITAALECLSLRGRSRMSVGVVGACAGVLSSIMSNTAVTAAFLPVADSLAKRSQDGSLRKTLYMAVGGLAVLGGALTLIGSTPQLIVQGVLKNAGLETFGFFTLLKGALPLFAIAIVYFCTVGYRLLLTTRAEGSTESSSPTEPVPERRPPTNFRMYATAIVLVACIVAFIAGVWTVGAVAITGALILIIIRCIDLKAVVHHVDWSSVVVLGGCLGFSKGLEASGAGEMLAAGIINLCGGATAHPLPVFAGIVTLAAALSCLVSNTAVAAMLTPLGIFLAQGMGFPVITMAVGIALASNICFATPIGTPPMTLTLSAGYRFTDYLKVGTPLCIVLVAAVIVLTPLLYGW